MKIGIVTLGGYWNYGNKLQNLALKYVLENSLHSTVYTIKNWQHKDRVSIISFLEETYRFLKRPEYAQEKKEKKHREENFKRFSKKNLNETNSEEMDVVIVGSDQVWNPMWLTPRQFEYFMLKTFSDIKKIAYAASIGVEELNQPFSEIMGKEMGKFHGVSVREKSGADIVERHTGKRPEVVLDPTMLLSSQEWIEALQIDPQKQGIVFKYVLGKSSQKLEGLIDDIAKCKGLNLKEYHSFNSKQISNYALGPDDFVRDIASADIVVTDSFHAAVFATIFHVPFVIAERQDSKKTSSRIDTLLETVRLNNRRLSEIHNIDEAFDVDYSEVDDLIAHKKDKAIDFLKNNVLG